MYLGSCQEVMFRFNSIRKPRLQRLRLVRAVQAGDPDPPVWSGRGLKWDFTGISGGIFRDSSGEIIMFMFGVEPTATSNSYYSETRVTKVQLRTDW